jgi:hypothetical protein
MWRLAFILYLLSSSMVAAGVSTGQIHIGFTITGIGQASSAGPAPATIAAANKRGAIPLPPERPVGIGRGDTARPPGGALK